METLSDLIVLAEFKGTRVPEAPLESLATFGPLLTHPQRVTFPWHPLRHALHAYFGTGPPALDPHLINAGWCGLALIVTAFKRLEVVESEVETAEVLLWLQALKLAAIRRSLACEATEPGHAGVLQDILANLLEPVPAAELAAHSRSRTASLPYPKPVASTSTSFERGSDATRSPPLSISAHATSVSPEPLRPRIDTLLDRTSKRSPAEKTGENPAAKRRRSNSLGHIAALPARARDSTVSTSALSSFADFSDHQDHADSSSESDEDENLSPDFASARANGQLNAHHSAYASYPGHPGPHRHPSASTSRSATGSASAAPRLSPEEMTKIGILAQRLNEVTGIPLAKCVETIMRFPNEDLSAINPNGPIPNEFLGAGAGSGAGSGAGGGSRAEVDEVMAGFSADGTGIRLKAGKRAPSLAVREKKEKPSAPSGSSVTGGDKEKRIQRPHDPNRPQFSYSALIGQAILSTEQKRMRLAEIYDFVTDHYDYYKKNECGWQNSIRHNLSLQPVFQKVPDLELPNRKGCFWTIIPSEEWRFANGGWMKVDKHGGGAPGGRKERDRREKRERKAVDRAVKNERKERERVERVEQRRSKPRTSGVKAGGAKASKGAKSQEGVGSVGEESKGVTERTLPPRAAKGKGSFMRDARDSDEDGEEGSDRESESSSGEEEDEGDEDEEEDEED